MAIIAISGKMGSGKDTLAKMFQILAAFPKMNNERVIEHLERDLFNNKYEIKRFADKLKDIVCLLLNCTRQQLEDRVFKEKELGEEWWYYQLVGKDFAIAEKLSSDYYRKALYATKEEAEEIAALAGLMQFEINLVKLSPRTILQLLGTNCGRNIIHPNIWVNSLMNDYHSRYSGLEVWNPVNNTSKTIHKTEESNWIIPDMRFPNELKAIEKRNGVTIRINRDTTIKDKNGNPILSNKAYTDISTLQHPSETALDDANFDYVIDNNGSLEDLIEKTKVLISKI